MTTRPIVFNRVTVCTVYMNNTIGARSIDLKWLGKVTPLQIMALIFAFVFALIMTLAGYMSQCAGLGAMFIALILFMLPRTMGVENIKIMTVLGLAFMVTAVLVGALITAPGFLDIENNKGNPTDNEYFADVTYTFSDSGVEINATLKKDIGSENVVFIYGNINGIGFTGMLLNEPNQRATLDVASGSVSGNVDLDNNRLYVGYLAVTKTDSSGAVSINGESETYWVFMTTDPFNGNTTIIYLYGCLYQILPVMFLFFMMMVFTSFMRMRLEKTRAKMEKEGRLYPKGYGRCEKCGGMVYPGELKCRKCGSYIERPEEMQPDKKDFFECSDCGAEVPMDAKTCPKCGAAFDEEEFVVTHSDGTVEQTMESFQCHECGGTVPGASTFCPRCGAKFKKK